MIDFKTRITPKFRDSKNFENVIDFLTTYDNTSLEILRDINNMDSQYSFILDEIGKTLGVFPRPFVPKDIDGFPTIFTYDISAYDTVPYADDILGAYRSMSDNEYSKLLRVFAMGINFNGTYQEWEDMLFVLTGAKAYFSNAPSSFGITVQKNLGIVEKALIEYALRYNSLTISIDYIGTTDGDVPFTYDVTAYDSSSYVTPW